METLDPIRRGDDEALEGQVFQFKGGPAKNITNDSLRFTVKRNEATEIIALQKSTSSGIAKSDAANGKYVVTIDPEDFEDLRYDTNFYCDVELTDGDTGKITTLAEYILPVEVAISH